LQSITEAADEAPTVEDALRAALSRICAHTGWQAGRLQFCADAGDLAHRTFWHLMDPERLPSYRALAQARRDAPDVALMARVLAHGSPLWTPVPQGTENGHAATGTRATVAFPVFVGTNLFALLEFFSGVEERPEPATVDAVSLACAELGRILQRKPADDELRRSEREYRALFENARDAILMVDPRAEVVVDANYHACELYGFPRAELVGATVARLWRDPDADRARLREAELGMGGAYESRHARKDGSMIVVEVTAGPVEYRGRRALWTSIRDVSDRIRVLEALRTSEERYRLLFDASPQAMWVFDAETLRFLAVNDAAVKRYGYSRDEFLRMTILDIRPPEDVPALNDRLERLAEGGATSANIWRHRKANGELMDVEVTSHAIELSGRRARLVVSIDVTERLRAEEKLWHAAFYDVLTGLPNRALFMERLGMALERAKGRGRGGFAVLFLDLDRFKVVNDSLGHRAGDQLLIQISRRLERTRRAGTRWPGWAGTSSPSWWRAWRPPPTRPGWRSGCSASCRCPSTSKARRSSPPPRSASRWAARPTRCGPRTCCETPIRRCTGPRAWASPSTRCSTSPCTTARWRCCSWRTTCGAPSSAASCACSTSRSWRWAAGASSASRRWRAGSTASAGPWRRPSSFPWRRRRA